MDATTLDPQAWPVADADLEPATIGNQLAEEIHAHPDHCSSELSGCDEGCYYWTAGHLTEWWLADTDEPGDVHLPALREADE
jgi:hypothetical protein